MLNTSWCDAGKKAIFAIYVMVINIVNGVRLFTDLFVVGNYIHTNSGAVTCCDNNISVDDAKRRN